jgi:hypothetical protein
MATHRTLRAFISGLFAMAIWGLVPATVAAGTIAEFTFKEKQTITFTNDGAQSMLAGDSIKVTFKFDLPNTYGPANANIDAQLELVGLVSGKATNDNNNLGQPMTLASLIVIADNKVGGKNQLFTSLALNRVSADLVGKLNDKTSSFSGPGNNSPRPMPAVSDFFDFSNYTDIGFQVQLTNMTNPLTINKNGYLDNFTASGSGVIFGQPIVANVPEPSSMLLLTSGAGLLTLAFLIWRPAVGR